MSDITKFNTHVKKAYRLSKARKRRKRRQKMSAPAVSIFKNVMDKSPEETTIEAIVKHIKSEAYKEAVEKIRTLQAEEKKKEADQHKRKLPAFAPSGVFKGGHAKSQLVAYNSVLLLDFDHVHPDLLQAFLKLCRECEYTLACWTTISGGIRVLVMTDGGAEEHLIAFLAVSDYYEKLLGIASDPACKDFSHLSFVSYDPNAYYNEESMLFPVPTGNTPLEALLEQFSKYNRWDRGFRNGSTFKFGLKANEQGFSEMETAAFCISKLSAPDFDAQEISTAIASAFKENRTFGTFESVTSVTSVTSAPVQFLTPQPNVPREEDEEEEDYTNESEELTANTPLIPEEVYNLLPRRLRRICEQTPDLRQRDILLLSALAVLSGCLPRVTGRYDTGRFSPHLYFWLLAEASTGKGVMSSIRHLAAAIHKREIAEYESAKKKYAVAYDQWLFDKEKALKERRSFDMDEPEKPVPVTFLIPTDLSKSMLIQHLSDNGTLGGILFTTEVQGMANATKQDYGKIEPFMCASYHNESIDCSFRSHGEPIHIESAKLAMALSGTPDQLSNLITNKRDGLFSRFLFMTFFAKPVWRCVTPDYETISTDEFFKAEGEEVLNNFDYLQTHPTDVRLTPKQWNKLNTYFGDELTHISAEHDITLHSVVKRHGFMTFRIAMVLTAQRKAEDKNPAKTVYCNDDDFLSALSIVECCIEHSYLLSTALPGFASGTIPVSQPKPVQLLLRKLKVIFTTQDAILAGATLGMKKRQVMRYIHSACKIFIIKVSKGVYRKI